MNAIMGTIACGLAAFYLGERVLAGSQRVTFDGLGAALMFLGLALAARRWSNAQAERRLAAARILGHYALCVVGLALYAALVLDKVPIGKPQVLAQVLWPAIVLFGLGPAFAMELALRAVERAPQLELWRIGMAARAARIVFYAVVVFAGVNFAATQWNRKIDLSYFKTSRVGTSNRALIEGLTQDVTFTFFFPPGNEVLEHAKSYVDELVRLTPRVKVEVVDQAIAVEKARALKVRENGHLVIASGSRQELLRLGTDIESAATTLRQLDADVQERLLKVLRPARIAYFTTGHLERDFAPTADDRRLGLADFKQLLEMLGVESKRLGLADGLGSDIPQDASAVIIAAPEKPFLPTELDAIDRYQKRGGRILLFADPDHGSLLEDLLPALGIRLKKGLVASDNPQHLWQLRGGRPSPYQIATDKASAHPSADTLRKAGGRLHVVVMGSGALEKIENPPAHLKPTFTLRSMSSSWVDADANGAFDKESEQRTTLDLAAAVEGRSPESNATELRALVLGDVDLAADLIVRNEGNVQLLLDGMRWLVGDEALAGTIETEKDVRIVHRKDEDKLWFYGSSVLMPACVLVAGVVTTRRSRRKRGDAR